MYCIFLTGQTGNVTKKKKKGKRKIKLISLVEWQSNKKLELFPGVFNLFRKKFLLLHMQSPH